MARSSREHLGDTSGCGRRVVVSTASAVRDGRTVVGAMQRTCPAAPIPTDHPGSPTSSVAVGILHADHRPIRRRDRFRAARVSAVGSTSQRILRRSNGGGEARPSAAARVARGVGKSPPNPAADQSTGVPAVYRDFIETKQACCESTTQSRSTRFSGKLRSNRQQLITRYAAIRSSSRST